MRISLALILASLLTMGFQCDRRYNDVCSGAYTKKDLTTSLAPQTSQTSLNVGDTLKFSAVVSDTLSEVNTANKYTFKLDQFDVVIDIFKVVVPAGSTVPNLEPVYSDFNPVIMDGQLTANTYGYGFKMIYRRLNTNNYLSGGLECGRKGTYIIRFKNENGYQRYQLSDYTLYPCTTFILNTVYTGPQNNALFTTYNVSTINPLPTYTGFTSVSKTDKNYVVINVN